jgi:hypothetical protein
VTLAELQALLHGRITGMVSGREDELRVQVQGRPPLEALDRVEIYSEMYLHRLVDAIAEDVPHTSRVLGHDAFLELVRAYLHEHPSARRTSGRPPAPSGRGSGVPGHPSGPAGLALLERARSEVRTARVAGRRRRELLSR